MRTTVLAILVAAVVLAQPCCCLALLGGPRPPYTVSSSEEIVDRLERRLNETPLNPDGTFAVTVTEEEITSLAARALKEMPDQPPISDPQVLLRNGRIEFYFTAHIAEGFALPGMLAFSLQAQGGKLIATVEEAAVGPFPIPESILAEITNTLNKSLSEGISSGEGEVLITDVQIGEKQMTISGKVE